MRLLALLTIGAAISGCGGTRHDEAPTPAPKIHQARALTEVVYQSTAARRARGEYLVEGVLQCFVCHSPRDWTKAGAPPVQGKAGVGAVWWDKPWLVAPNLTPDEETGIGRWTDDMLARAIREGISHDGRVLHPQMWYESFRRLADEDVAAVIVFLRSMTPVRNELPATVMPADILAETPVPEPITAPVAGPDPHDTLARGRYLAGVADCSGCHSSWHTPKNPGIFAGGNLIERSGQQAYSANITPDASGIIHYDRGVFREVMRTGVVRARDLSPVMPWTTFRHMRDEDLDAIFEYLMAFAPTKHLVDNINRPTVCVRCGGTHPLGEYNPPRAFTAVPYRLDDVRDFVGRYRFEDGFELSFSIEGGRFVSRVSDDPVPCELVTEDGRVFQCQDDDVDRVEFVMDVNGTVTGLRNNRADPAVKIPAS